MRRSSVYSLGVARWLLGDLAGAGAAADRERGVVSAARRLAASGSLAAEHRRDARRGSGGADRDCGSSSRRRCSRSSRSPARRRSATCSRTRRRSPALRGEPERARSVARGGRRALRARRTTERGQADVLVRRAYLALAAGLPGRGAGAASSSALRAAPRDARPARRRHGAARRSGLWRRSAASYDRAEQPLAEARELFRRAGDRWGLVSSLWRTADLAIARGAWTTPTLRCGEARAVVGADRAPALDRGHGRDARRGGAAAWRTRSARGRCSSRPASTTSRAARRGRRRGDAGAAAKPRQGSAKATQSHARVGLLATANDKRRQS